MRRSRRRLLLTMLTGGAGFSLTRVAGYLLDWNPLLGIYQDDARTIPVTADGDVAGGVTDQSPSGYHGSQGTAANKPIYKTNIANGKPALRFTTDEFYSVTDFLARTDTAGAIYAVFITRGAGGSGSHSFLTSADVATARYWWTEIRGDKISITQNNALGNNIVLGKTTIQTADIHIGTWRSSGTAYSYALDGAAELLTVSSGANNGNWLGDTDARDNAQMGALTYSGGTIAYANLDLLRLLYYSPAPSAADEALILAELASLYGRSIVTKSIVCDGDSLTVGSGAATSYPAQLITLLGAGWRRLNFGVGGQTIAAMVADQATQITPNCNTNLAKNVLVAWGGTNDLKAGTLVTTVEASYETYCAAGQAAGYQVLAMPILPREDAGTPVGFEADRLLFNTWLEANWETFADGYVPLTDDARLLDPNDTTYFNADKVHLIAAGDTVVAGLVYPEVLALP